MLPFCFGPIFITSCLRRKDTRLSARTNEYFILTKESKRSSLRMELCLWIPYSGKLSREKSFVNLPVLCLFVKVFSAKFGGVLFFGAAQVNNPRKFSPSKVSHYTSILCSNARAPVAQLVRASAWNSEDPGSYPGWILTICDRI